MIKVLNFMNLKYKNLYEKNMVSENIRKAYYKENTNVLAYYIITLILIYNYQDFLLWCNTNNTSLLQFEKAPTSQSLFCSFIEKKYKSPKMLKIIDCFSTFFNKIKNTRVGAKDQNHQFLTNNLRMTLCEMG